MAHTQTSDKIIGYTDSHQPIGYLDLVATIPSPPSVDQGKKQHEDILIQIDSTSREDHNCENKKPDTSNQDRKKLSQLVSKKNRILYRLKTVFPLSLFPDEITIEDNKIHVLRRGFFASEEIQSSTIKEITHFEVETSLLFATIIIGSSSFSDKSISISGFWTEQAKRARRIIEGLRDIQTAGIDSQPLSAKEILAKSEQLGTAQGVEEPA